MNLTLTTAADAKTAVGKAKTILSSEIRNVAALDAVVKLLRQQGTPYRVLVLK